MIEEYDYWARSAALLLEDLKGSFWFGRESLVAGTQLSQISAGGNTMYCAPPITYGAACLADRDNDGKFDQAGTVNAYSAVVNKASIDSPVLYKLTDELASEGQGSKYELVYQGVSGNIVQISYREYSQNLARPAYQQDLRYTLNEIGDTEVSFRDLRILIHTAGNNGIEYTVVSGL
jgi:hypothetical protein